jgi:hypothetical protein
MKRVVWHCTVHPRRTLTYRPPYQPRQVINSRLFTTVRDSLGLTYDVSFEVMMFDRVRTGERAKARQGVGLGGLRLVFCAFTAVATGSRHCPLPETLICLFSLPLQNTLTLALSHTNTPFPPPKKNINQH